MIQFWNKVESKQSSAYARSSFDRTRLVKHQYQATFMNSHIEATSKLNKHVYNEDRDECKTLNNIMCPEQDMHDIFTKALTKEHLEIL